MTKYKIYIEELDKLLQEIDWGRRALKDKKCISSNLNGNASRELRNLIPIQRLRESGVFFTSQAMARKLVRSAWRNESPQSSVYDPTCGAGDLLLSWAENFETKASLEETLAEWGSQIGGLDIHQEFVDVAKRRLILLAISKGAKLKGKIPTIESLFPNIKTGSVLDRSWTPLPKSTLLLNPPFSKIDAPQNCDWAGGKVSFAGIIFMHCLEKCTTGQKISAILPDVLRSGSRYSNWREQVTSNLDISKISILGRFDSLTDVDVFILAGQSFKNEKKKNSWHTPRRKKTTEPISAQFKVHVGPLVAYREPQRGPSQAFLKASDLIHGATLSAIVPERRYVGKLLQPPFIAIQRTSSPDDPNRPIASIVTGEAAVAVENHIITLTPIDGTFSSCKAALASLKKSETREWLNNRIRCRHLTVEAIRDLPIW